MNAHTDPLLSSHRTRSNVPSAKKPEPTPAPQPVQLIRRRSAHLPTD